VLGFTDLLQGQRSTHMRTASFVARKAGNTR
jgi:hypothetical protein